MRFGIGVRFGGTALSLLAQAAMSSRIGAQQSVRALLLGTTSERAAALSLAQGTTALGGRAKTRPTLTLGAPPGPFIDQTGSFTIQWDAVPLQANQDVEMGLSNGPTNGLASMACIVRFFTDGTMSVRNGGAYQAVNTLNYVAGQSYRILMTVRVATHTYDVTVTPAGGAPVVLATSYAFRSEQATVTDLNYLGLFITSGNGVLMSNMVPPGAQPPVVSSNTFNLTTTGATFVSGETVGIMSATNSPTSWAITAGNSAGDFAIDNTGKITVTSAGITALGGQNGTIVLTVQATNAAGSATGTATINYATASVPVVTNNTFNLTTTGGGFVAGDPVGTMTATNTPTSWAISAGNTAGNFAINNSGNITVTSAGVTNLGNTSGTATLTVQATNSAGTGSGTATINYAPASQWVDGLSGAPPGTPQQPNLLNNYPAGHGRRDKTIVNQPPFNVPGVDYRVGLLNPNILVTPNAGNMPAGCTFNNPGVTINGSGNVTFQNFDMGNGQINVTGQGGTVLISNCRWNLSIDGVTPVFFSQTNVTATVQYCEILNPNSHSLPNGYVGWSITIAASGGSYTVQYLYGENCDADCFDWRGSAGGQSLILQYNFVWNSGHGIGAGEHPDFLQGQSSGPQKCWNNCGATTFGSQGWGQWDVAFPCTFSQNVAIMNGSGSETVSANTTNFTTTNKDVIQNNYCDKGGSGSYFNTTTSDATKIDFGGNSNIAMPSGLSWPNQTN